VLYVDYRLSGTSTRVVRPLAMDVSERPVSGGAQRRAHGEEALPFNRKRTNQADVRVVQLIAF
jgi:hypothetical protein